jgi:hypothetical protein
MGHPFFNDRCVVFLDDMFIFLRSTSFADHVASRLDAAGFTLYVAKCQFGYHEIKCLGHIVNRQGVTVQSGLVDRILTLRAPSNQKEPLTFLSMIGFYCTHIKRFSVIAAPLYGRLGTKLPFCFSLNESDIGRFAEMQTIMLVVSVRMGIFIRKLSVCLEHRQLTARLFCGITRTSCGGSGRN